MTDLDIQPGDTVTQEFTDYFGFAETHEYVLPDGKQKIFFKTMNEGDKAQFQKLTQRDLTLERQSGNARMKINPAEERHALIKASVTGWDLHRGGRPYQYSQRALDDVLKLFPPKIIEGLELAIRKANPWLIADATVEEIDRQIEELQELREEAAKRESGEDSSSSK